MRTHPLVNVSLYVCLISVGNKPHKIWFKHINAFIYSYKCLYVFTFIIQLLIMFFYFSSEASFEPDIANSNTVQHTVYSLNFAGRSIRVYFHWHLLKIKIWPFLTVERYSGYFTNWFVCADIFIPSNKNIFIYPVKFTMIATPTWGYNFILYYFKMSWLKRMWI